MTTRTEVLEAAKRRWPNWRIDLVVDRLSYALCLHYSPWIGSDEKPQWDTIVAPTLKALLAKVEGREP